MADNITAPAAGAVLATDEISGVHWPFARLAFGADGTSIRVADADGARLPVLIGGTLPAFAATPTFNIGTAPTLTVSAASLPLPTGAATAAAQTTGNASLASIDGKFAALESGRAPVAVQSIATTTRAYTYASGQRITTSGTGQVRSTAVSATEILLHASVRGFFRVGNSSVAATVGAGSIPLEAGEKFHLRITSGEFVSFIRDGGTDGSLTIMPVA